MKQLFVGDIKTRFACSKAARIWIFQLQMKPANEKRGSFIWITCTIYHARTHDHRAHRLTQTHWDSKRNLSFRNGSAFVLVVQIVFCSFNSVLSIRRLRPSRGWQSLDVGFHLHVSYIKAPLLPCFSRKKNFSEENLTGQVNSRQEFDPRFVLRIIVLCYQRIA